MLNPNVHACLPSKGVAAENQDDHYNSTAAEVPGHCKGCQECGHGCR
mgnify:CR=1 FL=1